MTVRMTILGATALLLAGCGSDEYSVPAAESVSMLASLGYSIEQPTTRNASQPSTDLRRFNN